VTAEPKDRVKRVWWAVALAVAFVVGGWVWSGAGRSAESINALFSGLAFVVLVAAIFFQREELRLQRRELGLIDEALEC